MCVVCVTVLINSDRIYFSPNIFPLAVDAPTILTQPQPDLLVSDGLVFQLTVIANGSFLSYRWQRFGVDIFDTPNLYNGTGTNTLTVLSVSGAAAGINRALSFTVNVSNLAASIISSPSRVSISKCVYHCVCLQFHINPF